MTQITQINPEALNVASQMILKEIDLTGTDAQRKAKLDQFEADWKALTGASDIIGARFVGYMDTPNGYLCTMFALNSASSLYEGVGTDDVERIYKVQTDPGSGKIYCTPLFSHLEPIEIFDDNSIESKKKNIDNINTYKANLEQLGVDTSISFQIPIYRKSNSGVEESGFLIYSNLPHVYKPYSGLFLNVDETSFSIFGISSTGEFIEQTYYATLEDVQQANTLAQALKDLHTPIAISTKNTTESMAQNARNIADFVAKAKAAGIADVNGMAVTCLINNDYSAVLAFYNVANIKAIFGVSVHDDPSEQYVIHIFDDGSYNETPLVTPQNTDIITSEMLDTGARRPIILTPETTEVDEGTYQKLISDDVDVVFKTSNENPNLCILTYKYDDGDSWNFTFTCFSRESEYLSETYLYGYEVRITKIGNPHPCEVIDKSIESHFSQILLDEGFTNQSFLSPVLQEIDLTGTDAERKAKLDKFEADWKALTGANDMKGARFMGRVDNSTGEGGCSVLFTFDYATNVLYYGCTMLSDTDKKIVSYRLNKNDGSLSITPLFSHLEPVEIFFDNTAEKKKKNLDNLNAYKANLKELGVDTSISFQVIFQSGNGEYFGNLYNSGGGNTYVGLIFTVDDNSVGWMRIYADGEVAFVNLASEDAIKYSYTPVPLTATTSTNKTQLDSFLSKVPNAQVMNCTYKDVYAGTLHKINGSWYGVLVGESNTLAGQLSIKLQADGTIVEGTA